MAWLQRLPLKAWKDSQEIIKCLYRKAPWPLRILGSIHMAGCREEGWRKGHRREVQRSLCDVTLLVIWGKDDPSLLLPLLVYKILMSILTSVGCEECHSINSVGQHLAHTGWVENNHAGISRPGSRPHNIPAPSSRWHLRYGVERSSLSLSLEFPIFSRHGGMLSCEGSFTSWYNQGL